MASKDEPSNYVDSKLSENFNEKLVFQNSQINSTDSTIADSSTQAINQYNSGSLIKRSSSGENFSKDQHLNIEILNQLEIEANKVAASVDNLTENLTGILRSISALTLDCLETYRNCICKTCDAIDYNIKLMYQLMAKCEELNKVAEPLNSVAQNVKDIKNVLDLFDNHMNSW